VATTWSVPLTDVLVTEKDIEHVAAVYRSGWLSMGPRTAEFESAFAAYVGVPHACAVSSGTAALHLMCLAAGLGPGDEVIVPSLTFVATANAVRYVGATPVFVDIAGPLEPWMSYRACAEAVGPATRAIIHMGYGGNAGEIDALAELARERDLLLLQDAAHSLGTRIDGRQVGSVGHASAFSFFSNKNLAIGEGGMVATADDELARRIRLLRSHGMTALSWDRHRGHAAGYDVVALGYNYRLDEPRAAMGLRRLQRLDAENDRRRELDARYRGALEGIVSCASPASPRATSAHHLFTIVLGEGVARDELRRRLADCGIQTSVHYPPVHRFSVHAGRHQALPLTEAYADRTVTLPLFAHMTDRQQDLVIEAVATAVRPGTAPARAERDAGDLDHRRGPANHPSVRTL
jgi:dTDP-4-amino-4,6-dideoxygalactose transaminase